jgi:hypothetical protein
LDKAKAQNEKLLPINYFLSQVNGSSETCSDLFDKVLDYFKNKTVTYRSIQKNIIQSIFENHPYVKENEISICLDEAGAINSILPEG